MTMGILSADAGGGGGGPGAPPPVVRAIMYENWSALDKSAIVMRDAVRKSSAVEIWHKHGNFKQHLEGVWKILHCWGCAHKVSRLGLFHSAYSNSFVSMGIYNPDTEREKLRELVGEEAEELIYLYCIINRQNLEEIIMVEHSGVIPKEGIEMEHIRTKEKIRISQEVLAIFCLHTVADYVEQFMQWQEAMERAKPGSLWPGSGLPHIRLAQMSKLLKAAISCGAMDEENTPDVFNHGTAVLEESDEKEALEWYARATKLDQLMGKDSFGSDIFAESGVVDVEKVQGQVLKKLQTANVDFDLEISMNQFTANSDSEFAKSDSVVYTCLKRCSQLNPYVGEPFILMAQLCVQNGQWDEAIELADKGCTLLYQWGTQWDKRVSWEGWIAWGRCVIYQSNRKEWPKTGGGVESLGAVADVQRYRQVLNEGGNYLRY